MSRDYRGRCAFRAANRMIGDVQPGIEKPYTFSLFKSYTKDSPLLESGLLGPVSLHAVTRQ